MSHKIYPDVFLFILIILSLLKSGCSKDFVTDMTMINSTVLEVKSDLKECYLSELKCLNGFCVSLDKYCNGVDDCGDKSDEPKLCSPCNRTYYGLAGRTYELEVKRPREDRLPFICHLNFTANGLEYGDIVQLTFDTFTVGKFVSFTAAGCPDGYMSIEESSPSPPVGQWCGSAWGYTVYFSETSSINITLRLDTLTQQGVGYNFEFKLAYKFLRRSEAKLRYGNSSISGWRGDLVQGTYCDRVLSDCDQRKCRIQSPNFPGVYPRNATCTYKIEQTKIPPGKHALIAVRQRNSHKIHIKDQIVKYDRSQRVLKLWDQCNVVQDYLTIWDGASSSSPVVARLCGGDSVPDIISRGPNMLLQFHTSPYDNPFHPVPLSYLPGFELDVLVIFVDRDSHSYVREDGRCHFVVTAFDTISGEIRNPRHSLPPNTSCTYQFQGRSNEVVWISFVKYHAGTIGEPAGFDQNKDCSLQLTIWDGEPSNGVMENSNGTLLGSYCRDESPRLCDHALLTNATRATRPCSPNESYISTGPVITIVQEIHQGSAQHPVSFFLRYEFVDVSQEGQRSAKGKYSCDRIFSSSVSTFGTFRSPRSTFYYGRGGRENITCTLRFESSSIERVRLSFHHMSFGNKKCRSYTDPRTGRWKCDRSRLAPNQGNAEVKVIEYPWERIAIDRDCFCSNRSDIVTVRTLSASVVEVEFTVTLMNITDDYEDFGFEGEFRFIMSGPGDDAICSSAWGERLISGPSGTILLRDNVEELPSSDIITDDNIVSESVRAPHCTHKPWLLKPRSESHLYIWLRGREVTQLSPFCPTSNRIFIYSVTNTSHTKEICPDAGMPIVGSWSAGWIGGPPTTKTFEPHANSLIVEFLQRDPAEYTVHWLEVTKPITLDDSPNALSSTACPFRCPEINACISAALWCDRKPHCPSGFDEAQENCAFGLAGVSPTYAGAAAAGCAALLATILAILARRCRKTKLRRNELKIREAAEKEPPPLPDRREFATVQKYASIDRYGLKYSAGVNDARYYDEFRRDKLEARYHSQRAIDDEGLC